MHDVYQAGQRLAELRLARQWTQHDACKASGVPVPNISRLEKGATVRPSFQDVVAYGWALGLSPNELAVMYGYWQDPQGKTRVTKEDEDLTRLTRILRALPEQRRQRVLGAIEYMLIEQRATSAGNQD